MPNRFLYLIFNLVGIFKNHENNTAIGKSQISLPIGTYLLSNHRARKVADNGILKLLKNNWFVRQPEDHFYEAKVGTGDIVLGLLRLHLALDGDARFFKEDWSF